MSNNVNKSKKSLSLKLSHEQWLFFGLASTLFIILSLIIALTLTLGWSLLATATLVFFLSYPLIWLAWRSYNFWRQAIMQLTTYTQVICEGETNLRFKEQHPDNLLAELQQEISDLAVGNAHKLQQNQTLENVLSHILDSWPIPVCLFDENNQLSYRNTAMKEKIQQPMLIGTAAIDLGFVIENGNLSHSQFNQQQQNITQQNLIRVLAHELRNSLTPMASMADTLLSNDSFNEDQVRLVLSRIRQRSNRLLSFIEQYSQLSQLPAPQSSWFDFNDLLDEAKAMITEPCTISYQGSNLCFADEQQMAQILINIFKNAQEACDEAPCKIDVSLYYRQENSQGYQQTKQVIEINDNGPGFANLDNALTPFYTTKSHGSGIGLSLCAEITRNHGGEFILTNTDIGAKITMSWPVDNHTGGRNNNVRH